jgi:hypothetical protein
VAHFFLLFLTVFSSSFAAGTKDSDLPRYDPALLKQKISEWQVACEKNEGEPCGNLGAVYATGMGVEKSEAKAFGFYEIACRFGQPLRCLRAGTFVVNGVGTPASMEKAAELFLKGCRLFESVSCVNYYLLAHGRRITMDGMDRPLPKDLKAPKTNGEAMQSVATTLTLACDKGVAFACGNLGGLYEVGDALARDLSLALKRFEQACDLGEADRCDRAGRYHANGIAGPADRQRAAKYFERYCELTNKIGCALSRKAKSGLPLDLKLPTAQALLAQKVDPALAVKTMAPSAAFGENPIPLNGVPAEILDFVKACNSGDARACGNAGSTLLDESGKPKSQPELARALFEKACYLGRPQRCLELAKFYGNGWGGERSSEREKLALKRACELGDKASCGTH